MGIDVKKLDNAEAQREKEKATLYTRNAIVEALQETLPELVGAALNTYNILHGKPVEEVKVDVPFGEYANPSFESQVETLAKARPGVPMMSIEAQVEELYGDTKDEEWKKEEIDRLKWEQGIADMEEPGVNVSAGGFQLNLEESQMKVKVMNRLYQMGQKEYQGLLETASEQVGITRNSMKSNFRASTGRSARSSGLRERPGTCSRKYEYCRLSKKAGRFMATTGLRHIKQ